MDGRPLFVRVQALSDRFTAMAEGARKQAARNPNGGFQQVIANHLRDAETLKLAADALTPRMPFPPKG